MRPIFCGNVEYNARQSELERLFRRYGKVDRVDMKSGFAFVYMDDERDAEDAIRGLDRIEFGRKGRRLRIEWSKEERNGRRPETSRKSSSSVKPSKTLFVINFDPYSTRSRDIERHFDPYGKILNIRIRRNFAFVQYETQEDATRALDATNMSKLMDQVITVEYANKDDDDRRNGFSPDRNHDRGLKRGYDRGRSRSPYGRERGSPDYGRGRARSPSPIRQGRSSPDYGRRPSSNPNHRERDSEYGSGRSPNIKKERNPDHGNGHSPNPRRLRAGSENGEVHSPPEEGLLESGPSPPRVGRRGKYSPDDYRGRSRSRSRSPRSKPEEIGSPRYAAAESPLPERHRSLSPPTRERSRS
ncbi:serine/arginine-rich splicing factor RS31-like isoform X2 [Solanum verrucosum]|uniref:serine/arginine-rich splicing factor RS31-like isoform X2 n=2 Tax=Solanum verrucosum TaxID=315347 RepID=UPI0020D0D5BF|nr:serine/arginine-rich splicing factor RS31-like isoform X2 [Solanum verrucosum]